MKIKQIKYIGQKNTFDLEVDHPKHTFLCNNISVSNSHAISYTYISFQEYWLKKYYPLEFNVALLNNTSKGKEKHKQSVLAQYILKIYPEFVILPPDINKSMIKFDIIDNQIIFGLGWIKSFPEKSLIEILKDRKINGIYKSVEELFKRLPKKILNKQTIDSLVWSGSLDNITNKNRIELYNYINKEILKNKKFIELEYDINYILEKERKYLGFSFKELIILQKIKNKLKVENYKVVDLKDIYEETEYDIVAKINAFEYKKTKTDKDYILISLQDDTYFFNKVYVWPWKCNQWDSLKKNSIIYGKIKIENGFVNLINFINIKTF